MKYPPNSNNFLCLRAKAINMATDIKNGFSHIYLPSSTTPFERFHGKRPTISLLMLVRSIGDIYIREEERSSGS
jgi:hypothetical protein